MTCQASSIIDFELRVDFLFHIPDLPLRLDYGFQVGMSTMCEAAERSYSSLEAECRPVPTFVHFLGEEAALYSSTT